MLFQGSHRERDLKFFYLSRGLLNECPDIWIRIQEWEEPRFGLEGLWRGRGHASDRQRQ